MNLKTGSPIPVSEINKSQNQINDEALWTKFILEHDSDTKAKLLTRYAYLVRYAISRMKINLVPNIDMDDLESAGSIGLIKAMEKFSPERQVKFETYAYRWVQGSVLDYCRQLDVLSRTSREKVSKFKKAYASLRDKYGRSPTDEEIVEILKIDLQELNEIYLEMNCENPFSIEPSNPSSEDNDEMWGNEFQDKKDSGALNELEKNEVQIQLHDAIENLGDKEKLIISLYYYDDLTFKQIGEILNVSESRVCQLHGKAILNMQVDLEKKL